MRHIAASLSEVLATVFAPEHSDSRPAATPPLQFVPNGLTQPSVLLGVSSCHS